jgi:hypothetical protein
LLRAGVRGSRRLTRPLAARPGGRLTPGGIEQESVVRRVGSEVDRARRRPGEFGVFASAPQWGLVRGFLV